MTHIQTSFSPSELESHLANTDTVICTLTGSDVHLTPSIIDASSKAGVQLFIPSEYGLDTSNPKIRELLPPYQTRFAIQEKLIQSGLNWKAIYSGIVLEDALKTDGVLGIDALWASVVVFPHKKDTKIAASTYGDIAKSIVEIISNTKTKEVCKVHMCSFQATLEEMVEMVEKEIEKPLDRYEGLYEGAKKEAAERMKMGYFDGGVALLGRVAVWNDEVDAWSGWQNGDVIMRTDWQVEVRKVTRMVRNGEIGGGGCGC
jgi:NmrA-like family